ncbi:MAG TPA: hypothetical protein VFZ08_03275 [Terriglobia bacterium]|nr:hypothetical protein [Terriglobia bacterium]
MDAEKTMQFILETQTKHEIAIQQWDERFLKFQQETGQRFTTLVDVSISLANTLQTLGEETDRRIKGLAEAHSKLSEAHSKVAAETEYKLNALISTVDKLVKRNGGRE